MSRSAFRGALLSALAFGCVPHEGAHCLTLCTSRAVIVATTTVLPTEVTAQSMLRVCVRETVCSSVTMQSVSEVATGNFDAHVDVTTANDGNATVRIVVETDQADWWKDDDVWRLTIADANALDIFDASAQATYSVTQPDCEGTRCRETELALP